MAVVALDRDLVRFSFPVVKSAPDAGGDLIVSGFCTNGDVDRDMERIDPAASRHWLEAWLSTGGNVRLQHDPQRPVGKGLKLDFRPEGHYLTSIVVDPLAKELTRKGVLTAYSVGVVRPAFRADPTGKATRIITGRPDGATEVAEVSLVDRPSNPGCTFDEVSAKVAKRADRLVSKAASGKSARKAAMAALETADAVRVQMLARAAGSELTGWQLAEVTAGIRADLHSPDPDRLNTARLILGRLC